MKSDRVLEDFLARKLAKELGTKVGKPKKKRTLQDVQISESTTVLDIDPKHTVGNVVEPDKNIDWKDVKEKN